MKELELKKPQDLFLLTSGEVVSKRGLYDLIRLSKVEDSKQWAGPSWSIGNTPQQGINWVGPLPFLRAVIIKTRHGSYKEDGWEDDTNNLFRYSFKAQNGKILHEEKANRALINQPEHLYPIFLFVELGKFWRFEGSFVVSAIEERFVVLKRDSVLGTKTYSSKNEPVFYEGGRRYVTHLMVERNYDAVDLLKQATNWVCDICRINFEDRYGVSYIEAHHKIPISTYNSVHEVRPEDFALLCPNCHRAVHIYMKKWKIGYEEIKMLLTMLLSKVPQVKPNRDC